jgi:hypothetical protein
MSKHRLFLFVGASLLALAGTASADISLTDNQMNVVTAGASHFDFSKRHDSQSNNMGASHFDFSKRHHSKSNNMGDSHFDFSKRHDSKSNNMGSSHFDFSKRLDSKSNNTVNFDGQTNITDNFSKKANIDVKSHVIGNSASLGFDNEAIGKNSNAQGSFSQLTVAGQGSSQSGLFVSAANGMPRANNMLPK